LAENSTGDALAQGTNTILDQALELIGWQHRWLTNRTNLSNQSSMSLKA